MNIRTYFAYHLTHHFGPFRRESYYTNHEAPRQGDLIFVVSGDDAADGKDYWLEGLFRIHRRVENSFRLTTRKGTQEFFKFKLTLAPLRIPDARIPLSEAPWYDRAEVRRYFASGQNFNPLPHGYQERFDELLAGFCLLDAESLAQDLADIQRRVVDATERQILTQARIGQGRFRADVTRLWGRGEACALTGIALPEILIASHIKPWRDSDDEQRLDPANGLLLVAHADKLFDRHLLSFELVRGELRCVVAPVARVAAEQCKLPIGEALHTTHLPLAAGMRVEAYMAEHHQRFLARQAEMAPTD